MRQLRPELYSDSTSRISHRLKAEILSHHLETLTERNQTHDFEIFCRKLCERTLCPNLRPATGPEGGGDSKADTETLPVAEEITKLQYVAGAAEGGKERWAFAFSAKQKWADKARADVEGIVATGRGYQKIFFMTSRAARAKDRARVEDELSSKHGVQVTILDRSWILKEVIENHREDLAFNYLGIGEETTENRLGPLDYSRSQQLADIERELTDPAAFEGMPGHRAKEALVAAKLSRKLGLPRTDVEGRFLRAVRLAQDGGTYRQQLEARYESMWTTFWWFDDVAAFLAGYEAFEADAIQDEHARNLEFLCNLVQLIFNAVFNGGWTPESVQLDARVSRLKTRLDQLVGDVSRPNNALQARASLLILQVNEAMLGRDAAGLSALWPEFSDVLSKAEGLGEFEGVRLVNLIQAYGMVAGADRGYCDLVDQAAEFVAKRTSEGEGALILLRRAKQLAEAEDAMEVIRLLGRAGRRLSKKEYAEPSIEAMTLLAIAYRGTGLLWAARAAFAGAVTSLFIEGDESGSLSPTVFPTLMVGAWIAVELKHIPEALELVQTARGCLASLPFSDESVATANERLREFDGVLACQLINLGASELQGLCTMPDVLEGLQLFASRTALLYALGHEEGLRADGSIPAEESSSSVVELFQTLADQPAGAATWRPAVLNATGAQVFSTSVLGVRVDVEHEGTDASITIAEAVVGVVEAFFATSFEIDAVGHMERFGVRIVEGDVVRFEVTIEDDRAALVVMWPRGVVPRPASSYDKYLDMLMEVATSVFSCVCHVRDPKVALPRLFESDAAIDRIAMVGSVCLSRARIFGGVARLSAWDRHSPTRYELLPNRPHITRSKTAPRHDVPSQDPSSGDSGVAATRVHRDMRVKSVIDVHLWDRAGWIGAAYGSMGPDDMPWFALMFTDGEAATRIFKRWLERFGDVDENEEIYIGIIRKLSAEYPAHYGIFVTSNPGAEAGLATFASRTHYLHPSDDVNLSRFLADFGRHGGYRLMPAIFSGSGAPKFLPQLALVKRALSVTNAADATDNSIESVHLKLFQSSADDHRRQSD
ncbi:MAG: tetratricopeptide repeat protein [Comamonadaceae bacterium]|nr:tetratricopeptide repeat protein [Comamonadaceae bacterium]